ncbi:MAG: (d)CMP kinase [Leptotrichiaceae bacterium]|mgnify:FL=1|nr:(d)CMP kinase [Leptotrichiaceae bacterium]MBP6280886.1 (d)CMP kinase [Leptotrichiaceae bacterium]MBP7739592.1 (d)CMP kinase [Leptotrichiaceae bacterium]MBP9629939.1 (d)CMP kinase [Leptotrichiaceae bacterium]
MIIAIDGPAGSGKSTIAKLIAKDLGMIYLDTGAMYRLFTLKILKEKINFYATKEIIKLLSNLKIDIKKDKFYLDGEDVTEEIRKTEVSMIVSKVATIKEVRETMVDHQIEFSKSKNIILDGRDIGTVVFPNADLKIFLVADPMERAKRRYKELIKKGEKVLLDEIYENIVTRDKIDSTRKESPLKKAEDAVEVDTTYKNIEEVKEEILEIYRNKFKK